MARATLGALLVLLLPFATWSLEGHAVTSARGQPGTSGPPLTVVSLNMARKSTFDEVAGEISTLVDRHAVDVFLFQEVQQDPGAPRLIAHELAETLGFYCLFQTTDHWKDGGSQGLAILSRYPIENAAVIPLKHFDLGFRQRNRIGLAATLLTPLGPVRVVNVHLDSRINTDERLAQLSGVLESEADDEGPSIVGGDFNTGDFKWLTRWFPIPLAARQGDAVRQLMSAHEFDTPFAQDGATFKYLGLRLDWIFTKGLQADSWGIDRIDFSDHRAIWLTMSSTLAPPN
jgi:endonuclease/exonuclease/phosphatase family metal-dependent hydrolase